MKTILQTLGISLVAAMAAGCGTTQIGMVDAFRSDDIPKNAMRLHRALIETNDPPIQVLEKTLHSDDYQQRQMAASVLRRVAPDSPSDKLLEVTVEGLADDCFPYERTPYFSACTFIFNARDGVGYLMTHGPAAKRYLLRGVRSDDYQMQYYCAYLLGVHGITDDLDRTAAILIRHLRDNLIRGDAAAACSALYRLGDPIIPYLREAIPSEDKQQMELITLIHNNLTNVPFNDKERQRGSRSAGISVRSSDPSVDLVLPDFYFPRGRGAQERAISTSDDAWY